MKPIPVIYIVVTEGKQRLEISGTLDLFERFMSSMKEATICNPIPQVDEFTAQEVLTST